MPHVDVESILDGLEGRLGDEALTQLRSHLAECETCAAEFSRYGELLDALSRGRLEQAPETALRRAFDIFSPDRLPRPSLREVLASVLFDSWSRPAVAGLRSQGKHSRQLSMTAGEFDLHLGIDYDAGIIRGQLLSRAGNRFEEGFDVRLLGMASVEISSAVANRLGEFAFRCDPERAVGVVIHLANGTNMRFQLPSEK